MQTANPWVNLFFFFFNTATDGEERQPRWKLLWKINAFALADSVPVSQGYTRKVQAVSRCVSNFILNKAATHQMCEIVCLLKGSFTKRHYISPACYPLQCLWRLRWHFCIHVTNHFSFWHRCLETLEAVVLAPPRASVPWVLEPSGTRHPSSCTLSPNTYDGQTPSQL